MLNGLSLLAGISSPSSPSLLASTLSPLSPCCAKRPFSAALYLITTITINVDVNIFTTITVLRQTYNGFPRSSLWALDLPVNYDHLRGARIACASRALFSSFAVTSLHARFLTYLSILRLLCCVTRPSSAALNLITIITIVGVNLFTTITLLC